MKKLNLVSIEEAEKRIDMAFNKYVMEKEQLPLTQCRGRILAEDITSMINVPDYRRSTVDGYAIRVEDLEALEKGDEMPLTCIGRTEMGILTDLSIKAGETVYVPTGGMVPDGATAMVMQEYTRREEHRIFFSKSVEVMENMIGIGGDIEKGSVILHDGTRIRTQEIGAMASVGKKLVEVLKKPRISILCTGDELITIDDELKPGKIRDMNTITLKMIAEEMGCTVVRNSLVKDDYELIQQAVNQAVSDSDVVVVSGGSSVGEKDVTADIFRSIEKDSVILHGIRVKPGKPTIVAKIHGKPVFGLPGHPVSALNIFRIFVKRALDRIQRQPNTIPRVIWAANAYTFKTSPDRDTYQMVRFTDPELKTFEKVTGKSGMITLLTKADGYILVRASDHEVVKGEIHNVVLFD